MKRDPTGSAGILAGVFSKPNPSQPAGRDAGAPGARNPWPLLAFALVAALFAGCAKKETAPAEEHQSAEPESRVKRGTNGEAVITLDVATQKVMGLQVSPLAGASVSPEVKGYGRVLDPAPLGDLLMELRSAQIAFDNSHQELERMKVLRQQQNASERAFQAAESAYLRDQALVAATLLRIQATWGRKLAELSGPVVVPVGTKRNENPLLEESLELASALIRVDLPAGESLSGQPGSARLVPLAEGATPVAAEFFDFARNIDPQTQAQGMFFLVRTNQPRLTPGMALTAFINIGGPSQSGVLVPRPAVVRFNGATWVYLQTDDETFQRTEVALERPAESGWFAREGLKPQDRVVVVGAQQLLSEELKGQIGGE